MDDKKKPKEASDFCCKICDFNSCKISNYNKHLLSSKHKKNDKRMTQDDKKEPKEAGTDICSGFFCKCGKEYKHRQGLWKHKKVCAYENNLNESFSLHLPTDEPELKEMFIKVVEQNQAMLLENQEMRKLLQETIPKIGNTTNNTTNNTSNTHNFNLNFFLNEQCKDALNIMDFINQLQIKLSDLDMVGRVGYSEGISNIFVRGLKELDVSKRPIHCSDLKREVLYVKDKDSWEKDNEEKDKVKNAIKYIAAKNFKQINEWKEENPDSEDTDTKKHMEYQHIIMNSMGGATNEDDERNYNKIIRNVAKEVVIEKNK